MDILEDYLRTRVVQLLRALDVVLDHLTFCLQAFDGGGLDILVEPRLRRRLGPRSGDLWPNSDATDACDLALATVVVCAHTRPGPVLEAAFSRSRASDASDLAREQASDFFAQRVRRKLRQFLLESGPSAWFYLLDDQSSPVPSITWLDAPPLEGVHRS